MLKALGIIPLLLISFNSRAVGHKSICGIDDRLPSENMKVGRLLKNIDASGGCTVTMISKSCAISAGHCTSTFGIAEFNTPPSIDGNIQHPAAEDIYEIDKTTINSRNGGIGNDWAVFKLLPNSITSLYAGNVQGIYKVSETAPTSGEIIRITGYGLDRSDPDRNLAQQTHTGEVMLSRGSILRHVADTMGGNSGSSIIRESDQTIVAIHTNGGCRSDRGSNSATIISNNIKFREAIKSCLESDK